MDGKIDMSIERAEEILKKVFGYDSFRPLQKEIIASVLLGKDTLAVMPTGGGKSICYQIPALIFEGITIVISPLISLMQDQVSSLIENGVDAVFLNSSQDWEEYLDTVYRLKSGSIKIVYLSPEAFAACKMQSILQECSTPVSCITIDEAHCISEWGHDFRPDYMGIAEARRKFENAVCLALTATATANVQKDIINNLKMKTPTVFTAGFNRKNIYLEVRPKHNALNQTADCIEKHKDESGIIYCFSRKQVDSLTQSLKNMNYSVLNYHAGLSDEQRAENQDLFIKDKVKIMVATVAFGMGIDKPNVRFVIHYDIPKSLEEYYQEIGRAGRDGLPAHALLLYSSGDIRKIRYFFDEAADPVKSEKLLQKMISYACTKKCRRKVMLSYFGEKLAYTEKNDFCCDLCSEPVPLKDVTICAQKLMSCIIRTKQNFGASYVIDVLLGSKQKRILENAHDKLSTWGIGKELSKDNWFELIEEMILCGFLEKSAEFNILIITSAGLKVLKNREKIELPVRFYLERVLNARPSSKSSYILYKTKNFIKNLSPEDEKLYEHIKEWRKNKAEKDNVPPYVIFGDKTIEELVTKKPVSKADLLDIFGIGIVKADKFGDEILDFFYKKQH